MEIMPGIEIMGLALYADSALIISDAHIGYEESLNKQGVFVPRLQFDEMLKRMNKIFSILKDRRIEKIIINGDLKHEFGTISEQEWRNTLKFLDLLAKHCNEIILIKGNHDTILGPIAKKREVKVVESYFLEKSKILIIHGDKIPNKETLNKVFTIIIGHEHPAISLREGPRVEQVKCFLKGKFKGKNLIVQPSFNPILPGTDLLKNEILSLFLRQNLDNFEVFVVEDKVYRFGKMKGLRFSRDV
ncbi:metallophosphoesterase [Candidatus Woesearchaeota archaeon]|nr:metallophosphoesterase [Candidatus Woesearchaeota archaeon]